MADDDLDVDLEDEFDEDLDLEGFEGEEAEAEAEAAAEPPEFANLPDGRALILRGSGVGTFLPAHEADAPNAPAVRDRDEALSGTVPLFLCQRGAKYFEREPEVLSVLHANHGDALAVGAVVMLPRPKIADRLNLPVAQVRIADPMGFIPFGDRLTLNPDWPVKQHVTNAPYLTKLRDAPSTYSAELLDAQRAVGANLLLTSGRPVDAFDIAGSFAEISDEADQLTAELRPGERLALNLTLSNEFMVNQGVFDEVLNELSELEQFNLVYVRIQRSTPADAAAPLADLAALNRLVNLGVWAERQGVGLIHAQSGLVGWLLVGSGSLGFSTGSQPAEQMFRPFVKQGGGGKNLPRERHFERCILHAVSRASHEAMVAHGTPYEEFPTRWGDQALAGASYDHRASAPHYLYSLGWLTADAVRASTPRGGWRAGFRGFVHDAHTAAPQFGLAGWENPTHLNAWVNVV